MRNNPIFGNIPEDDDERPDQTEIKVRNFMNDKLRMAQDTVKHITFERVHRIGPKTDGNANQGRTRGSNPRRIVCKFYQFQDREAVRKLSVRLKGTDHYITEQSPLEINRIRKELFPKMREARRQNRAAWICYDTLYVEGKPVRTG